jgi:ferredoxin/flavodoxin---NADP+ reductase
MTEKVENLIKTEVLHNVRISNTSGVLYFNRNFVFKAGQVMGLTTQQRIPPRLYSITSGEKDTHIEILYKIVPKGQLTPRLNDLQPGEPIYITNVFGTFLAPEEPAFLIATGTGIAPFISMIRSGLKAGIILLHGSRKISDFYFESYLRSVLKEKYIQCFSGVGSTPIFKGRVTEYLRNIDSLPIQYKYYLCGSAEMVVDVRDILIDRGIPFLNIVSEIYF